jgi:OPT oligopeptide transporter protein
VDDQGVIRYREDPAINGLLPYDDIEAQKKARGEQALPMQRYDAPKTKLMALIIDGILNQKLPWSLVLIGALMAVSLELCMVPSLPFAVGIYLPLQTSFPIFVGGVMRWIVDLANPPKPEESESSPGVLLSSGYIAGGSIVGVLAAFLNFKEDWLKHLNLAPTIDRMFGAGFSEARWTTMTAFTVMLVLLLIVGTAGRFARKAPVVVAKGTK